MKKLSFTITNLILLFTLVTIVYLVTNTTSSKPEEPSINIILMDLYNSQQVNVNFSEKPSVLLFFTSWCPYCNEDAPKIVSLSNKYKDQINIYGINISNRDDLNEVKKYVKKYNITYPILKDELGDIYKNYGSPGFPTLFFIDSKGKVIDRIIGSTDIELIEKSFVNLKEKFL